VGPLRVGFSGAGVFSTWAIYPALHVAPIEAVCGAAFAVAVRSTAAPWARSSSTASGSGGGTTTESRSRAKASSCERTTELSGDGPALMEFVRAIRDGREPIASIHDAVRTIALYQAIVDAARAGRQGPLELSPV
jgi:hypothetical protein